MLQNTGASRSKRKKVVAAQEVCAEISALTKKLPDDQTKIIINNAIDMLRANLRSDLESHATSLFDWDKLPGEVKNDIYRRLLVADEPIRPLVFNHTPRADREWSWHHVEGQVLVLNKTIYEEALPILLGDNTFILNADFARYFPKGYGLDQIVAQLPNGNAIGTDFPDRATMVRRLVINISKPIPAPQMTALRRLKGLEELIITHQPPRKIPIDNINDHDWEQESILDPDNIRAPLVKFLWQHPKLVVHYIGYKHFEDREQVSTNS
jgi:hypothetical protein